jgi:[acyl-carrier-protein] S-malonyltransferase
MAKKYAFLFPGQGAQFPGMMQDVADAFPSARTTLDRISEIAGENIADLLWKSDADTLKRSDRSQLAITAASIVVMAALKEKDIEPAAAMGFSLGEFPALYAAGVLSFEDTVKVVKKRGEIMQRVCESIAAENEGHAPGMAAVIGLPPEKVVEIASSCSGTYAANMNSARQTVLSATAAGLDEAEAKCKAAGARRFIRLAVAGPFHSPLMQKAADEFEKMLVDIPFQDPDIPLFSNVTGKKVLKGDEAKKSAVLHLTHPVLWTDEEKVLGSLLTGDTSGEWFLIEPGPGKVLTGLWRDSGFADKWTCTPVNTADAVNAL